MKSVQIWSFFWSVFGHLSRNILFSDFLKSVAFLLPFCERFWWFSRICRGKLGKSTEKYESLLGALFFYLQGIWFRSNNTFWQLVNYWCIRLRCCRFRWFNRRNENWYWKSIFLEASCYLRIIQKILSVSLKFLFSLVAFSCDLIFHFKTLIRYFCVKRLSPLFSCYSTHYVKSARIRSFSRLYVPALRLSPERYSVRYFSPNAGKYGPEKLRIRTLHSVYSVLGKY